LANEDRFLAAQSDEGRYRLLLNAITDYAICMLDPTGVVSSWNPGAQRFKGYTAEEINDLVRDMTELLHRTLGEHVELEGVLSPRLWPVEVDKNQLEGAVLNLAVNARDAMPSGGKLTLETANTYLDANYTAKDANYTAKDAEVIPGQYVMISVTDTGSGIPDEVLSKVFEPFFTTKELGRGTGLGLSMVYGFVKQSGGHITIYSEEAEGTSVKLYFPRYRGEGAAEAAMPEVRAQTAVDDEVILVVEDNPDVRAYSVTSLTELGYHVLEAMDAESALKFLSGEQRVDLPFTDVVLPGRSGRVLANEAAALRPKLKVLFTTGYSRNAIVHQGRLDPDVELISKPFTFEQLATLMRATLGAIETALAPHGFVRTHRAWLVNRRHIRELAPAGSGDGTLALTGGLAVPLSRRLRAAVTAAAG